MSKAQAKQNEQVQLNSNNTVVWRGEIDFGSVIEAETKLMVLVAKRATHKVADYPIYLVLDSPGGDIEAGLSFIQFAKTVKNLHTITIFAASMASGIVEALPGRRLVTDDGMLMFHRARASVEGQVETGELETRLAMIKRLVLRLETVNAQRLGISLAEYKSRIVNEMWMDSEQAMAQGGADKVVDIVCSTELAAKRNSSTVWTFFGGTEVTYSGCPLFRIPLTKGQ